MTDEDDAFIRTIVDNPGNDVPRLVYADWLDDRDDPRGPFLRAEVEFARKGKGKIKLRKLAAGLDPLWVARVVRPPFGVCVDHVRWTDAGPPLSAAEIRHVEERLGATLPEEFTAFLLNYNGGKPAPPCLPYPPAFGWDDMDMEIHRFFSANRYGTRQPKGTSSSWKFEIEVTLEHLHSLYRIAGEANTNPLLAGLIPLAEMLHDSSYLFVGVAEENRGRVFRFGDYCRSSTDPRFLTEYAESIPQLLSLLRPVRA